MEMTKSTVQCQISINVLFHFISLFSIYFNIMFKHVVLLLMLSGLLPKSHQEKDDHVLVETKEGETYLTKDTNIDDDENVGTDYSMPRRKGGRKKPKKRRCLVKEGPAKGQFCQFPFTWKSRTYDKCAPFPHGSHEKYWCYTRWGKSPSII